MKSYSVTIPTKNSLAVLFVFQYVLKWNLHFGWKCWLWQFHGVTGLSVKVKGSMKAKWDLLSCGLWSWRSGSGSGPFPLKQLSLMETSYMTTLISRTINKTILLLWPLFSRLNKTPQLFPTSSTLFKYLHPVIFSATTLYFWISCFITNILCHDHYNQSNACWYLMANDNQSIQKPINLFYLKYLEVCYIERSSDVVK